MASKLEIMRKNRNLSQGKLEKLTGISQQQISQIETGKAVLDSIRTAAKFAKALDCSISDLVDVDKDIDKLFQLDTSNLHNYLKATRELFELSSGRVATILQMSDNEYLDLESKESELTLENARLIAATMFFAWQSGNISNTLKYEAQPVDMSENEQRLIKAMRSQPAEDQEKMINVIKAIGLIK